MKKILVFFLLLNISTSCDKPGEKEFYDTGELYRKIEKGNSDTFRVTEFYKSGSILSKYQLFNDKVNGYYFTFFPNGKIKNKCLFKNGLKEGIQYSYNELDSKYLLSFWKNGLQNIHTFQFGKDDLISEDSVDIKYKITPKFTIKGQNTKINVELLSNYKIDKVYMNNQSANEYINYESIKKHENIEFSEKEFTFNATAYSTGLWELKFDILTDWNGDAKRYYTVIATFHTGDLKNFNEWNLNRDLYSKSECILIKH